MPFIVKVLSPPQLISLVLLEQNYQMMNLGYAWCILHCITWSYCCILHLFQAKLRSVILRGGSNHQMDMFIDHCYYHCGEYDQSDSYISMSCLLNIVFIIAENTINQTHILV